MVELKVSMLLCMSNGVRDSDRERGGDRRGGGHEEFREADPSKTLSRETM